jgi:endo-1,4-beta-xylanase
MKRRDLIVGSLGMTATLAMPGRARSSAAYTPGTALKTLGARAGLKLGVQASRAALEVPEFARFVMENFDLVTPGLELKWAALHPAPDTYTFDNADWMIEFCQKHGLLVHGHNLCWNSPQANPSWLSSVLTRGNARYYLSDYIKLVMKRYSGRIESWDVVNEPVVGWSKRDDGLYPGLWVNLLGETYLDIAFDAAHTADPGALRVLNCYYVEQDGALFDRTRALTLALLKRLQSRRVPIQAVGIESHLDGSVPAAGKACIEFVHQVRDMGLQVLITELDVDDTRVAGDKLERDDLVAKLYYDYLTQVVPAGRIDRVIFWTPSDRWNWLNSSNLPPSFRRADGQAHRPGLLDDALQPKASYAAVREALQVLSGARPRETRWPITH